MISMSKEDDDKLRESIFKILTEEGLVTQVAPVPEDHIQFEQIMSEARELPLDDLRGRLVIGGLTPVSMDDQSCERCMYYLVHRKWCDLPGLDLPVEPEWWCRLWRI